MTLVPETGVEPATYRAGDVPPDHLILPLRACSADRCLRERRRNYSSPRYRTRRQLPICGSVEGARPKFTEPFSKAFFLASFLTHALGWLFSSSTRSRACSKFPPSVLLPRQIYRPSRSVNRYGSL